MNGAMLDVEDGDLSQDERAEGQLLSRAAIKHRRYTVPRVSLVGAACLCSALVFVLSRRASLRMQQDSGASEMQPIMAVEQVADVGSCSKTEKDVDYVFQGAWFKQIDNIGDQDTCCQSCAKDDRCKAWTWVQDAKLPSGNPGQCWLKGGYMRDKAEKVGVVSGMKPGRHSTPKSEDETLCAVKGQSCITSKCCKDAGYQCFKKDDYWAQCMDTCVPGPNPLDQASNTPWACEPLGERTQGKPVQCAKESEDCRVSRCCEHGGMQCYEKNATYAKCRAECSPGSDLTSDDWLPWSCKELGTRSLKVAQWTSTQCSQPGQNCMGPNCCAVQGQQCFAMNQWWGECMDQCTPGTAKYEGGPEWACDGLGMRTPIDAKESENRLVGKWVPSRCSGVWDNCSISGCCQAVNKMCYQKVKGWAQCQDDCSTLPDTNNETWTCAALGPRSWGLPIKGYPSLYCVSLYMPSRYEKPLLQSHLAADAGIFACDGYDVFAAEPDTLGTSKDGIKVEALLIPQIDVGISQDGTAGNAKLFMAFWDKIIAAGRFRNYDFTIKVDPDAVIVAPRVRLHMEGHIGKNVYVVNCNKFPGSPNFPMMYGAVEIFTNQAMTAYAYGSWRCGTELNWKAWGEDYYMTHCLDHLGVGRIDDFGTLGDAYCTGANCKDTYTAAFHPFKDPAVWMQCWDDVTGVTAAK